jgi:hypothetical protein
VDVEKEKGLLHGLQKSDLKGNLFNFYSLNVFKFFVAHRLKSGSIFGELGLLMNR